MKRKYVTDVYFFSTCAKGVTLQCVGVYVIGGTYAHYVYCNFFADKRYLSPRLQRESYRGAVLRWPTNSDWISKWAFVGKYLSVLCWRGYETAAVGRRRETSAMTCGQRISESGKGTTRPRRSTERVGWTLEEELRARYWRGVSASTAALFESSVAMLFLTYKATRGSLSVENYCRRELDWKFSKYKDTFAFEERVALECDPLERSYDPELNAKLLTKVWTVLGSDVVCKVKALQRLLGEASHDPPRLASKRQLREHLCRIFRSQQDIRDKILRFCQASIERELEILSLREWKLKLSLGKLFKELGDYEHLLSLIPLERAIHMMTKMHLVLAISGDQAPDMEGLAMAPELRHVPRALPELEQLAHLLASTFEQMAKTSASVERLGGAYESLFLSDKLVDIAKILVKVGGEDVSDGDLGLYISELRREKSDCVGRLRVLGKSEILGFHEMSVKKSYSVHMWLLSRTLCNLNVEKVYSLVEFEDRSTLGVEELLNGKWPLVIISGPVGSGKTCISQYIFRRWRDGGSPIARLAEVDLVVPLAAEHASDRSFVRHIRKFMFPQGLCGTQDDLVYASLRQLRVLFVLDLEFVTKDVGEATSELFAGLGENNMIVMARPEVAGILRRFLRGADVKMAHLRPLSKLRLQNLCADFLSCRTGEELPHFAHGDQGGNCVVARKNNNSLSMAKKCPFNRSNINIQVRDFIETLMSEKRDEELRFPLPIAFMMLLWEEDRSRLRKVTSVSRLFQAAMSWCASRLRQEVQESTAPSSRKDMQRKAKKVMESVFHIASETLTSEAQLNHPTMECFRALSPFLACVTAPRRTHSSQKHAHVLLHGALAEFVYARSIVDKVPKERNIIQRCFPLPKLPNIFPVRLVENTGGKYVTVIRHVVLLLWQLGLHDIDARDAKHLARLYLEGGVSRNNYMAWVSLLHEGAWPGAMKKAVAQVIEHNPTWRATEGGRQTHALCVLVTHGVYGPQRAVVTTPVVRDVMAILRVRPEIGVCVSPPRDFQGVRSLELSDALVHALQDPGNLEEFWGRLDVKGAAALASMSRLRSLHVCLASLSALRAFSRSLADCVSLRQLHLYLELPEKVAPDRRCSLACSASLEAYLHLSNVSDSSWEWAVRVIKGVGGPFQDVYLSHTRLSPPILHSLKDSLRPTRVHVCESKSEE